MVVVVVMGEREGGSWSPCPERPPSVWKVMGSICGWVISETIEKKLAPAASLLDTQHQGLDLRRSDGQMIPECHVRRGRVTYRNEIPRLGSINLSFFPFLG